MVALGHFSTFQKVGLLAIAAASSAAPSLAMEPSAVTAARLYSEISSSAAVSTTPNFIFSPFSILEVLQVTQKGAAGETRKQIDALVGPRECFYIPELKQPRRSTDQQVSLVLGNRMFVEQSLEKNKIFEQFQKQVGRGYDGKWRAETLNFADSAAAAVRINDFVAEATQDHIKDLIRSSDLSEATRLVLANALYFKAPWLSPFKLERTVQGVFASPSGPQTALFMHGQLDRSPLLYSVEKDLTAVALPYADERLRLYVFMPESVASLEAQIAANPETLEKLVARMEKGAYDKSFSEVVNLAIPKFKLFASDNRVDLVKLFKSLGAPDMFDASKADFSEISGDKSLFVSIFLHQADIDVNEQGTEATAATAAVMMLRSTPFPKNPIDITIDKPFLFQLRFQSDQRSFVLFSGRVANAANAQ